MLPGPNQIIACPHCKGLAKHETLMSGNTFGATNWTDGKQDAPMLPMPPTFVRCQHCEQFYWLADAKEIGQEVTWDWGATDKTPNPAWAAAPWIVWPNEEAHYLALERGLAKNQLQEKTLRLLAWWRRNDAFRTDAPLPADASKMAPACKSNLEALAGLMEEGIDSDRLMKAELMRELGQFDTARQVLSTVTAPQFADIVRQLNHWCDCGDTLVRELKYST